MPNLPPEPPRIPFTHHRVTTDDGVDLAVQSTGAGPPVLLGNGIGVTAPGLNFIADHLRDRHRVICWDYRGVGESWLAGNHVGFTMERHARDALQLLDALGEERAAMLGWSMGVPVGLEMIRQAPDRVAGYGALFGAPGQPFRAAFPRPAAALVHLAVRFARHNPWPAQAVLRLGATLPILSWAICSTVGFVGKEASRDTFQADVRSTAGADKRAYFNTMFEMMHHDASDLLPSVRCPVLIVAGENDWVTPPDAAQRMADATPDCEFVMLPSTSHFGVIEHGPELWGPIDRLLDKAFG
ncbi:MAG: alpha/beta hydrolase [bacterium]